MKHSTLAQLSAAAVTLVLFTACSGDRHGGATVPRRAGFVGLWMSDAAHRDISKNMGDLDKFCGIAFQNPSRHGLTMQRLKYPSAQIFEIVPGGTVYRWSPNMFTTGAAKLDKYTMGRVDSAGVASMQGYGGSRLGTLRFTDFDHLVQLNGDDLFPATQITKAQAYPASPEFDQYARGAGGQRGFTRVDRGFAEMYVNQICKCDPEHFPVCGGDVGRDTAPAPAPSAPAPRDPVTTPRGTGTRPLPKNSWDEDAPAAPVVKAPPVRATPNRGHTAAPAGNVPGSIEDDQD